MKKETQKLVPLSTLELRALILYAQVQAAHRVLYREVTSERAKK
jgi:hypothetical protein